MSDLLESLAYLDLIDPIEGFISTFRYADWNGAFRRAGLVGVIGEFVASLGAINCWTIWVQRDAGWNGFEVEALLMRHGVRIWGRGFIGEQIFFRVKKRQAGWAEYLLLRRGVPVTSGPFDPRNADYAERYAPGSEPPARTKRSNALDDLLDGILSIFG
ncbi:MAG: hypothetical protein KGJ80_03815 [Chloroflexota bacterium]|nr:hypothetical protein [Chloroflexota bacterium]